MLEEECCKRRKSMRTTLESKGNLTLAKTQKPVSVIELEVGPDEAGEVGRR